ncbi:PI-PLC X domain-containing protein 3 isoform X2 [Ostrinia furnacalis]|uniref:PI-PLC X domain-containing protein 3 isoform X2 n=1 Tax=Ostrinia furnacalis TaxID=93504 RepID=UPI00103971E0|nr:PI-PLC X domain-containing protein 3 isoform X2 [Ostrinia furnacalis]
MSVCGVKKMKFGVVLFFTVAAITMKDSSAQIINLEYWMKSLPEPLKNVPLIYLAIPGSHDSMTFGINRSSELAPDAEPILHRLFPLFRGTILRWTITQATDTMQQLLIGIRYFDLRLATKKDTDKFYFTHGLYADEISKGLNQVKSFIDSHPGEVVILDFQHFYGFQPEDHQKLMRYLLNLYGPRLVPRQMDLQRITLNSLERLRQQVVVVYRHQSVYATDEFWQPQMMPSPWPQKDTVDDLLHFLTNVRRHPGMGFVHQAVLTPTPRFIVFRWRSTLRDKCAAPVKDEILPKLAKDFEPGPPLAQIAGARTPVNVVIADFVEMEDAIFPRTIIQMNLKLLKNTDQVYHNHG